MTIIARDQASRVVNQVQKKVMDFGKDIGSSIAAVAGPMALATMAFSKISQHFEEMAQKRKEAFDWGASLEQSAGVLGVTVEQMQALEIAAQETGENVQKLGEAFKSAQALLSSALAGNEDSRRSIVALGFSLENLDKLKPQDVLRALAGAMASVEDPAKKGEIAIAALGKEAGKLQSVLEKGFDIAGAFVQVDGLSTEEARNLRELEKEERAKANREKLEKARTESTKRALFSGDREVVDAAAKASGNRFNVSAEDPKVQAAVREVLRRRQKEADEKKAKEQADANKTAGGGTPEEAGKDLLNKKAEDDKREADAKAAKEAKEKADKERAAGLERQARAAEARNRKEAEDFAKEVEKENERVAKEKEKAGSVATKSLEVSSLRAIGGAMAGENMGGAMDVQTEQLNTQKKMVEELSELNEFIRRQPTNFTLPGAGPTMIG